MATYSSYKKLVEDSIPNDVVTSEKLELGAGMNRGTLFVYSGRGMNCQRCSNNGGCVCQACGRCCQWTVPSGVSTAKFEIWSGGGGGPGNTCCDCHFASIGGAGGNYAQKTIETRPGCSYTVCAGGSWRCNNASTCEAGMGCKSFVTGQGLSNFCVNGGCGGWACIEAGERDPRRGGTCANCGVCGIYGADLGMMGTPGMKQGNGWCHCTGEGSFTGQAPIIGMTHTTQANNAWCSCGCYVNWPAGGGASGVTSYCGDDDNCNANGVGQGGSGLVKITFA